MWGSNVSGCVKAGAYYLQRPHRRAIGRSRTLRVVFSPCCTVKIIRKRKVSTHRSSGKLYIFFFLLPCERAKNAAGGGCRLQGTNFIFFHTPLLAIDQKELVPVACVSLSSRVVVMCAVVVKCTCELRSPLSAHEGCETTILARAYLY